MPLISCLCPTYNFPPRSQRLLEEAVESFLRQDYTDAELIIGNDCPQQVLIYQGDERVRIINYPERFATLGQKLNALADAAKGDYIARWDSDDISLPWRLTWSMTHLLQYGANLVAPRKFWATNRDIISFDYGAFASCLYRAEAAKAIGGYRHTSFGEDQDLEKRIKLAVRPPISPHDGFYVYRWNTGHSHLSGFGAGSWGWTAIGLQPIVEGTFELQPCWDIDYVLYCQHAADKLLTQRIADAAAPVASV